MSVPSPPIIVELIVLAFILKVSLPAPPSSTSVSASAMLKISLPALPLIEAPTAVAVIVNVSIPAPPSTVCARVPEFRVIASAPVPPVIDLAFAPSVAVIIPWDAEASIEFAVATVPRFTFSSPEITMFCKVPNVELVVAERFASLATIVTVPEVTPALTVSNVVRASVPTVLFRAPFTSPAVMVIDPSVVAAEKSKSKPV